jgi:hypothetical protein
MTLLQQSQIIKLDSPAPRNLSFLREWMWRASAGYVHLISKDKNVWSETILGDKELPNEYPNPHLRDLVTLKDNDNIFTDWVFDTAMAPYHWILGRKLKVTVKNLICTYRSLI